MSSVYLDPDGEDFHDASKAVDGIYELPNIDESLAHSKYKTRPWWRVDLGDVHCVWAVNILNRYHGKHYRLITNFRVYFILQRHTIA